MNKVYPLDVTSGYPRGAAPLPSTAPEGENIFSIQRVIRAVRRRLPVMIAVFVLTYAAVAAYTFHLKPLYTATSRVIVNTRDQKVIDIGAVISGMPANSAAVDTEAEILHSRTLIEDVVKRLDLMNSPEFNWSKAEPSEMDKRIAAVKGFIKGLVPFQKKEPAAAPPPPTPEEAAEQEQALLDSVIDSVRGSISVNRLGSTYIIEISATSPTAKMAAKLTNTLADAYLDYQRNTKLKATKRAREWLDERVADLRNEVQVAESKAEAHRSSSGLLSAGGATLTEKAVTDLQTTLAAAQADYNQKSARKRNLDQQIAAGAGIDTIAEALSSANISSLRAKQADIAARKAEAIRVYGEKHPTYQRVLVEEADNNRLIEAELRRISSNLDQEVLIARENVNSLQTSLNKMKAELASNNHSGVEQAALEREAAASRQLYEEFNNRFKETNELVGLDDSDAVVDSYAPVPGWPSYPKKSLNLMLGFMLGGALAAMVGLILELLDSFMSSPEEVEQVAGVPFIGQIPLLPAAGNFTKSRVKPAEYLIDKPHSGFAEAYRHLRASIMFADIDKAAKTVAIVSSLPSEGKTSMTYCLGRMSAMSGTKTIVIDGDIRLRQLTEVSGVKAEAGLLEYLFGEARLADAVHTDEKTGLHILPLSERKHTPRDVFGSRAFDALLNMLQQTYDLIIIDTGPILLMAETRVVTSKVDQVVVATRWRKTNRRTLRDTMKILRDFRANVTGVVLTFVDLRKRAHHAYASANYKAYAKYYHEH
ncbi:MAG TPA: polysaccharide biosynthesis tyrosine autokinase [Hyphomonadaceae bacterium]|nr:polysaccharide biosynthesis tyrosine autokinase [Hyphomonadaceae bacterium]